MGLGERVTEQATHLKESFRRHPLRWALPLSLAVTAAAGYSFRQDIADSLSPGQCSEGTPRFIPHPDILSETYAFDSDNTDGGLLKAPIRALFATRKGLLIGHATPNPKGAPDSNEPVNPVRSLSDKGWEVCEAEEPIKGSVNAITRNLTTGEIFVVKDTEDPFSRPGNMLSRFDQGKWRHFPYLPGVLDYRGYSATTSGDTTLIATYNGIVIWHPDRGLKPHDQGRFPVHAVMMTSEENRDLRQLWVGGINNGLQVFNLGEGVASQSVVPKRIRDIKESPNKQEVWVAGEEGLVRFDKQTLQWEKQEMPDQAARFMSISFDPQTGLPCVAGLEGGYCFDGLRFGRVIGEPLLAVAHGHPDSSLKNNVYFGSQSGRLHQISRRIAHNN